MEVMYFLDKVWYNTSYIIIVIVFSALWQIQNCGESYEQIIMYGYDGADPRYGFLSAGVGGPE